MDIVIFLSKVVTLLWHPVTTFRPKVTTFLPKVTSFSDSPCYFYHWETWIHTIWSSLFRVFSQVMHSVESRKSLNCMDWILCPVPDRFYSTGMTGMESTTQLCCQAISSVLECSQFQSIQKVLESFLPKFWETLEKNSDPFMGERVARWGSLSHPSLDRSKHA